MAAVDVNLLTDLLVHRGRRAEASSVLIVGPEAALPASLAEAVRAAGFALAVRADAESGMAAALADTPTCIVCSLDLPDADGCALVRWVRAHDDGPLWRTSVVALAAPGDPGARLRAYRAGADVCIGPTADQARLVVSQIDALVRFAERGRGAITGDVSVVPVSTLLSVLELERRSGVFEVASAGHTAHLELVGGQVATARLLGAPTAVVEGVRAIMGWPEGRFCFRPTSSRARKGAVATPLREVLVEAARIGDEAAA